jgi:glycerophosphoryl diester phosphodiesterase
VTLALLRQGDEPLRIGHRGAAALSPENTLASFEQALELGMDGVEFDVVCPDSRSLVVCHEPRGTGPRLDEALAFFAERKAEIIQIDMKAFGQEALLVDALRRFDLIARTVVSSFRPESLRAVAVLEPRLARSFTFPEDRFGLAARRWLFPAIRGGLAALRLILPLRVGSLLERADAQALTLHFTLASRALIAACHARGAAVWVWTVNDPGAAARLARLGADAIITDDPRIFRAAPAL